jgi:hypothetical protein
LSKNRKLLFIILAIILITFCYGVVQLLLLRFKKGDVYAPYSSLRSDPLGTRVLFESLARLDGVSVRRNYQVLSSFRSDRDTTFLYIGAKASGWEFVDKDFLKHFEKIATVGGRLVLSFVPVVKQPDEDVRSKSRSLATEEESQQDIHPNDDEKKTGSKQRSNGGADDSNKTSENSAESEKRDQDKDKCKCISLREFWGLSFDYHQKAVARLGQAISVIESDGDMRLSPVTWHTLLFFDNLQPPWKSIYTLDGRPVIIERSMGRGSIVFTADSFFFSNEALRVDRNPDLLAWLIGPNSKVVFDEYHFGIVKTKGIAALIRNYRLHWFFVGIAFLAVLVAWKNSTHFVPPSKQTISSDQTPPAPERDYTHGLISLLRRNIAVKDVLKVCVAEWKKAVDRGEKVTPGQITKIESVVAGQESHSKKETDPVVGYRKICSILAEGKKL